MTFLWQILERRQRLLAFGVCFVLILLAFLIFTSTNLFQTINLNPQTLNPEGFSNPAIFFMIAAGTLFSEDLTAISAGVLASQGKISLTLAITSSAFGIFLGDILLFLAGRFLGRKALKMKFINYFISENSFEKSSLWLEKQGMKAVFISRFIFGLRLPLYFAAGVLKTNFWRFTVYFSLAVALWTPLIVGLTYKLGAEAIKSSLLNQNLWLGLLILILFLFFLIRIIQQLLTWKSRRILWGRIKKKFIWEFWSLRIFYIPVVFYICRLALRHRSLTIFACANPAILAGGFVGESKVEILEGLEKSEAAKPFFLHYVLLTGEDKLPVALEFMREKELNFPIVLKPDVGERGFGVKIIKSGEELIEKLKNSHEDLIMQEFAHGEETSVFYYRFPSESTGQIFAITEKQFPKVLGDGEATLEELILRDKRAICLAKSYLEQNSESLETIPEKGQRIQIIDIGTHSRGAVFLDGGWMKTEILEKTIDEICRGFAGFYFGRFDLRVSSFEEFRQGKNFKIVELNGVTSEATSIYDKRNSLLEAYRILFRQWRLAFEIGAENRKLGVKPTSITDLIKLILGKYEKNHDPKSEIRN